MMAAAKAKIWRKGNIPLSLMELKFQKKVESNPLLFFSLCPAATWSQRQVQLRKCTGAHGNYSHSILATRPERGSLLEVTKEIIREKLLNNVNIIYSENPYNLQRQTMNIRTKPFNHSLYRNTLKVTFFWFSQRISKIIRNKSISYQCQVWLNKS